MKTKIFILSIIMFTVLVASVYLAEFLEQSVTLFITFILFLYLILLKMLPIHTKLQESEKSNKNYSDIIDKYVMTSTTDANGIITDVSQRFCDNVGLSKDALIGKKHNILKHHNSTGEDYKELWDSIKSAKEYKGVIKNINDDGKIYWLDAVISPTLDTKNKVTNYTEVGYDVTAQMQSMELAKEIQTILDVTPNIAFIVDNNDIDFCNRSFLNFFGIKNLEDFKKNIKKMSELFLSGEYFNKNDFDDKSNWISKIVEVTSDTKLISIASFDDKKENIFSVEVNKLLTKNNRYLIVLSNITIMTEEALKHEQQTNYDALTFIHNKHYFNTALEHELSLVKRYNHPSSLLIFNIDFFKNVNETYGRDVGDEILIKLSKTVKEKIRENDLFARFGGEEFVIVSTHTPINQMEIFAEILRKTIESTKFHEEQKITCSFGVAEASRKDTNDSFIKRATKALHRAKTYGRNRVEVEKII